jgi:hypothetical protein
LFLIGYQIRQQPKPIGAIDRATPWLSMGSSYTPGMRVPA